MANPTTTDRIRRGKIVNLAGAAITGSYAAAPQFIGAGAARLSFWVKVTLAGATSITVKLENAYSDTAVPVGWATVGTRRHDVSPNVENGEHAFAADGLYLLTTEHAVRATDKLDVDAAGNTGGLRFSLKADGTVAAGTKLEIWAAAW